MLERLLSDATEMKRKVALVGLPMKAIKEEIYTKAKLPQTK